MNIKDAEHHKEKVEKAITGLLLSFSELTGLESTLYATTEKAKNADGTNTFVPFINLKLYI